MFYSNFVIFNFLINIHIYESVFNSNTNSISLGYPNTIGMIRNCVLSF